MQRSVEEGDRRFFWDIHDYDDAQRENARKLLDLLGIDADLDGSAVLLPLRETVGSAKDAVHLQTRSAWDILRVFGAGIEVPESHLEARIVEPVSFAMPSGRRAFKVRSSGKRPDDATVRIRFRDRWFYIDATDTVTKKAFLLLRTFVGIRLAEPGAAQQAPVLTVPVN